MTATLAAAAQEVRPVSSPYVALGDSDSSGAGAHPPIVTAPATCSRSQVNFAEDIAARPHPASSTDVTCSGAKTAALFQAPATHVPPQLTAVTSTPGW